MRYQSKAFSPQNSWVFFFVLTLKSMTGMNGVGLGNECLRGGEGGLFFLYCWQNEHMVWWSVCVCLCIINLIYMKIILHGCNCCGRWQNFRTHIHQKKKAPMTKFHLKIISGCILASSWHFMFYNNFAVISYLKICDICVWGTVVGAGYFCIRVMEDEIIEDLKVGFLRIFFKGLS